MKPKNNFKRKHHKHNAKHENEHEEEVEKDHALTVRNVLFHFYVFCKPNRKSSI